MRKTKRSDTNSRSAETASVPEVGLYWMSRDGRQFYKCSVALSEAADYGDCKMLDVSHDDQWPLAVQRFPSWGLMEYFEVPRGRVVFSANPDMNRFVLFLPSELRRFARQIAVAFGLPLTLVDFDYSDLHYRLDLDFDRDI